MTKKFFVAINTVHTVDVDGKKLVVKAKDASNHGVFGNISAKAEDELKKLGAIRDATPGEVLDAGLAVTDTVETATTDVDPAKTDATDGGKKPGKTKAAPAGEDTQAGTGDDTTGGGAGGDSLVG